MEYSKNIEWYLLEHGNEALPDSLLKQNSCNCELNRTTSKSDVFFLLLPGESFKNGTY